MSNRLAISLENDTVLAAQQLVGRVLVRVDERGRRRSGRIVETEAYTQYDPSSHSYRGPSARNAPMFEAPGVAYVYLIYGVHHCLNISTAPEGTGEAVLIRALEPIEGIEAMMHSRSVAEITTLCSGPGKLCQAMEIDRSFNGTNLLDSRSVLRIEPGQYRRPEQLDRTFRIGLSRAQCERLRFVEKGSRFLSRGPASETPVTRAVRRR